MRHSAVLLALLLTLLHLPGCGKKAKPAPTPTPTPTAAAVVATPTPTPTPTRTPVVEANKTAEVIVLCYHRFEDRPRDSLAIKPVEFEAQMQALKDQGIAVISMADFLAWRRNEKAIPQRSAVITLDDGWLSGYLVAWPILQKFGYPFTMFIYTNYVKGGPKSGGQSMSWEQLAQMRDAGVDIESHTVSHQDLRAKHGKNPEQYAAWLQAELGQSKQIIENNLGTGVKALAYPYGNYNQTVRDIGKQIGYEAMFTVYGQKITWGGPSDIIGRYAITSTQPQIFQSAISFPGGLAGPVSVAQPVSEIPVAAQLAAASMITEPASGATVTEAKPVVKANLATMGKLEPASVEMRISGFGLVPAQYDAATQMITYQVNRRLQQRDYTVIISGKADGKKVETRWSFKYAGE